MIIQIQVSGCTSNCQGVSQVQKATQTAANLQTVGASGQHANQLEAPSTPSQPTTTITQIQVGCLEQCFGTTTTSTVPEPLAQQILDELSSLVAPDTSSSLPAPPGTAQTVVDQVSCQVQTGQASPGTGVQIATQSSATVQLIDPSSSPQPTSVDQTGQQTWQLQIGCLFYCTDTQQVQEAQQAITTIQVLVGQPGSSTSSTTGAVGAVSQLIWQLQIGCIKWCYHATQVQDATSQTTVTVITVVPPAETPPAPAPPPADPSSPPDQPVAAQPGAVASTAPTPAAPSSAVASSSATPLPRSMALAGMAILDRRPSVAAVPPPAAATSQTVVSTVVVPVPIARSQTAARVVVMRPARPTSTRPHQERLAASGDSAFHAVPLEAVAGRSGSTPSILFLALGLVAAGVLWAYRGSKPLGRGR